MNIWAQGPSVLDSQRSLGPSRRHRSSSPEAEFLSIIPEQTGWGGHDGGGNTTSEAPPPQRKSHRQLMAAGIGAVAFHMAVACS